MKGLKRFYLAVMLAVTLAATGCGSASDEIKEDNLSSDRQGENVQSDSRDIFPETGDSEDLQTKNETSSFLFVMSTSYSMMSERFGGNYVDFNGGYVTSGTMKTGDKAMLVKSDGSSYEAIIERMALYREDDKGNPTPAEEVGEGPLVFVWLENNPSKELYEQASWKQADKLQYGDMLFGMKEWEYGIPVDFPFEESEEYFLTFGPRETEDGQGEFRLYDRDGVVLQRFPYGVFELPHYYIFCENGRRNLLFFPDKGETGRFLEWDNGHLTERETKINAGLLLAEETETELIKEKYKTQEDGITLERKRSFTLRKDTGELRVWDDIAGECLFETTAELNRDGNPVNQDYYNFLFRNAPYDQSDDYDPKVYMDLEYENEEWHEVSYESKEAFLAEYGVENSTPRYQSCDRYGNPRLELYEDQSGEQFCGIIYRKYYVTNKKEKWAKMYGFTISKEKTEKEKWSDNTYSIMSKIGPDDEKGYEETIEYTEDEKPIHFESRGLAEVKNGSSIEEELIPLMEVDYIYRDDGTLFYRGYWHTTYLYMTNDHVLSSFYDEKERVVYEDGYITSGDLEYYYVYEGDGNIPLCKLDVYFSCHGGIDVNPTWYY